MPNGLILAVVLACAVEAANVVPSTSPSASPTHPDKTTAQLLIVLPSIGLLTAASLTQSPWPALVVPASLGLGHLYAGEPTRAAMVTALGPLATYGGGLLGVGLGLGLSALSASPRGVDYDPTGGIILTTFLGAAGALLGLSSVGKWALEDVGRIADERNQNPLGPAAPPSTSPSP